MGVDPSGYADGCVSFSSAVADVFLTTCLSLDTIHEGIAVDGEEVARGTEYGHGGFFAGADLLVHDCQYADAEFKTRIGVGVFQFCVCHCRCESGWGEKTGPVSP